MTAIAGLIDLGFEAGPSDDASTRVTRMVEQMLGRRPLACFNATSGRSAVARGTLAERRGGGERRGPRSPSGGIVVIADARLDDDDAIDRAYDEGVDPNDESPDEAAIRAAYLKHGVACAAHLVGDYAFVIIDPGRRRIVLGRDPLGNRGLYVARRGRVLAFASEAHTALTALGLDAEPNVESIARHLVRRYSDNGPTLLRGVESVRPGHTQVFEAERTRSFRHSSFDTVVPLPTMGDEEVALILRDVLSKAVRRRLRRARGVGVTLSGGNDSSAVACLAERERRRFPRIEDSVLSLHSRFPGLACDEPEPFRAVVAHAGLRVAEVNLLAEPSWSAPRLALAPGAPLYFPSAYGFDAHFADAARLGVDTVLSGEGGDLVWGPTFYDELDEARAGRLFSVLRRTSGAGPWRRRLERTSDALLKPSIPAWMRRLAYPFRNHSDDPFLARRWQDAMALEFLNGLVEWEQGRRASATTAVRLRSLEQSGQQQATGRLAYFARRRGLAFEHPFLDRDVLRVSLAMPARQQHAIGWGKSKPALRRSMRGIVPDSVLRRRGCAEYSSFARAVLLDLHPSAFAEFTRPTRLIDLGVIRPDVRFGLGIPSPDERRELDKAWHAALASRILQVVAMELWLRQLQP